jgi:hypothetical protein
MCGKAGLPLSLSLFLPPYHKSNAGSLQHCWNAVLARGFLDHLWKEVLGLANGDFIPLRSDRSYTWHEGLRQVSGKTSLPSLCLIGLYIYHTDS